MYNNKQRKCFSRRCPVQLHRELPTTPEIYLECSELHLSSETSSELCVTSICSCWGPEIKPEDGWQAVRGRRNSGHYGSSSRLYGVRSSCVEWVTAGLQPNAGGVCWPKVLLRFSRLNQHFACLMGVLSVSEKIRYDVLERERERERVSE